jgi:hypothetical protein
LLLFITGDVGEVFGVGFICACWGIRSGCCIGVGVVADSGGSISAGGSVNAGGSVGSGGLIGVRAAGFSCFYGVEGASLIYLLLCEGGGIIGVPDAVMLVQVVGNCGSFDRAPTLGSAAPEFFFLSHLCCMVGRCSFTGCDSSWRVVRVMDLATSPRFGAAWLGERWICFLADGLMRPLVMALPTVCAWGGRSCAVISVYSRVLVAKWWGCCCNCTVSSF